MSRRFVVCLAVAVLVMVWGLFECVYLNNLNNGQPYRFSYRLMAKFPLVAQTLPSAAYDYYNPGIVGEAVPQILTVAP